MNSNKKMLIIGNGPSTRRLAEYGFHNLPDDIDTFGMGAAYRYFYGIDWWPTYYACCDSKVVYSHRQNLKALIEDSDVTTRKFFFPLELSKSERLQLVPHSSTGDFCFKKAIDLGYNEIYLIGVEGSYVEEILESRPLNKSEIKEFNQNSGISVARLQNIRSIKNTPNHAENYFFSWYQAKGDVYSLPFSGRHRDLWGAAAEFARVSSVSVINLSDRSLISHFDKIPFESVFQPKQASKPLKKKIGGPQSRAVKLFMPTVRTENEYNFWREFYNEINERGYRPIVASPMGVDAIYNIAIDFGNQFFFHGHPMRLARSANRLENEHYTSPAKIIDHILGFYSILKNIPMISLDVNIAVKNMKRFRKASTLFGGAIDEFIKIIDPRIIIFNNDTIPQSMLMEQISRLNEIPILFSERSPTISQWFEPEGFYAGALALDMDNSAWLNDPEFDAVGAPVLAQLESNPAMHRSTAQEQGFQLQDLSEAGRIANTDKPVFLFPMDAVLNTGWLPTGHPKRALNYPMFETPFDAIRALKTVAERAGAQLWIKPHPGCRVFNAEDSFDGVPVFRGSIDEALAHADLVFCFLTKVAFAALAQKKRTVLLSPSIASLCPAAFPCTDLKDIEPTVARAMAHEWSDGDTTAVRRFLGWLDREYFIANDLSNPAAKRMLDQYFPPLPAHLPEPDMEHIMKQLGTVPGAITPKRPADAPADPDCLLGPFERDHDMRLDEVDVILNLFKSGALAPEIADHGVMLDVGACKGSAFEGFAEMGWEVHAFEPNPPMYAHILEHRGHYANVKINQLAVSETTGEDLPFYTSEESIGISSLSPFRDTHKPTAIVKTIRLDEYCGKNDISRADFLKIDTEGFDIFVLKSHDWARFKPKAIICEYEDFKTEKLGYRTEDTAALLEAQGYAVYVSEWHPIIQYGGGTHRWKAFKRWRPGVAPSSSWGNLVAFREPISERVLSGTVQLTLEEARMKRLMAEARRAKALKAKKKALARKKAQKAAAKKKTPSARAKPLASAAPAVIIPPQPPLKRPFYAPFGDALREHAPALFPAAQRARRAIWSLARSAPVWIAGAVALAALGFLVFGPGPLSGRLVLAGAGLGAAMLLVLIAAAWRLRRAIQTLSAENRRLASDIASIHELAAGREGRVERLIGDQRGLEQRLSGVTGAQTRGERTLKGRLAELETRLKTADGETAAALRTELSGLRELAGSTLAARSEAETALRIEFSRLREQAANALAARSETETALRIEMAKLEERLAGVQARHDKALSDTHEALVEHEKRVLDREKRVLDHTEEGIEALRLELIAVRQGLEQRLRAEVDEASAEALKSITERLEAAESRSGESEAALRAEIAALNEMLESAVKTPLKEVQGASNDALEIANAARTHAVKASMSGKYLRERVAAVENQLGALKYHDAPDVFVFFGHHKCASRFFRNEVFGRIAESTGARVRKYQIENPPHHYSRLDDLDLPNIDFSGLGENGRDVVLFANATQRSLDKIRRTAGDWRGLRIVRDPRQVLVSSYFHHKGGHPYEGHGWVWDQLKKDKPVLNELPEEEGILHELDHISKHVIEDLILAPFDDERVLTLRLEDFSVDPAGRLAQIAAFLKVPDVAGLNFDNTGANPDSGPWRNHFTSEIRERFKARYGQALIDLGYEEDMDW